MSSVRIECVAKEGCRIGESPVWDEKEGALLYVDITGRKVCRWSPVTRQAQAIPVGKEPLENLLCVQEVRVGTRAVSLGSCSVLRAGDLFLQPGFPRPPAHWGYAQTLGTDQRKLWRLPL